MLESWAPASADAKVAFAEFQLHLREITPRVRVVHAIFALNVLVFAAMVASGVSVFKPTVVDALTWGANYGPRTLSGQPWRLVANVFVHFGIVHLAANMFVLWNVGGVVERLFGPLAFAAIYFAAGITASVASLVVHPTVVSAGASGAVFGVYGALAAFVLLRRGAIPKVVLSRLGGIAGSFIVFNVIYGAAQTEIDNAAHLGGLIGGFAAGAFLIRPLVLGRPSEPRRPALTVAAAVVLAGVVVLAMPRPLEFQAIIKDFAVSEKAVWATYNATMKGMWGEKIGLLQASNEIAPILPQCYAAQAKLETESKIWLRQHPGVTLQSRALAIVGRASQVQCAGIDRVVTTLRKRDMAGMVIATLDTERDAQALQAEFQNLKP